MRYIFIFFFLFVAFLENVKAQINQAVPWFVHGSINAAGIYDVGYVKVNDFILNDYEKISPFSYWIGVNTKLLTNGENRSGGFSLSVSSGKTALQNQFADLTGFRYCLGLVLYKQHHYYGPQLNLYFSQRTSDFFLSDNLLNLPIAYSTIISSPRVDNIRYRQNSLGLNFDLAINQLGKSSLVRREVDAHYRFSMGLEFSLPSSKWIYNRTVVAEYYQSNLFSGVVSFQLDFGKCTPKLLK